MEILEQLLALAFDDRPFESQREISKVKLRRLPSPRYPGIRDDLHRVTSTSAAGLYPEVDANDTNRHDVDRPLRAALWGRFVLGLDLEHQAACLDPRLPGHRHDGDYSNESDDGEDKAVGVHRNLL